MRTNEERTQAMHLRAAEIKKEQRSRRILAIEACVFAVCIVAVITFAVFMPKISRGIETERGSMSASIFAGSTALGYIIIGILAFILGIVVTVFCVRLKKWQDEKDKEGIR